MSRRVVLAGGNAAERARVARVMDDAFDVDVDERTDLLSVLRLLPNKGMDLLVVLGDAEGLPGVDLVRFVHEHALHRDVPIIYVGEGDDQRREARAAGATSVLSAAVDEETLRRTVATALRIG